MGEGLLFAAVPAACAAGTTALLVRDERSLDELQKRDQQALFPLAALGLIGSVASLVDAASADARAAVHTPVAVQPAVRFAPALTTTSLLGTVVGAF